MRILFVLLLFLNDGRVAVGEYVQSADCMKAKASLAIANPGRNVECVVRYVPSR